MTPAAGPWLAVSAGICRSRHLGGLPGWAGRRARGLPRRIAGSARRTGGLPWGVTEQLLDPVPPLLHPVQWQAEFGDGVADLVVGLFAGQPDKHRPVLRHGIETAPG